MSDDINKNWVGTTVMQYLFIYIYILKFYIYKNNTLGMHLLHMF